MQPVRCKVHLDSDPVLRHFTASNTPANTLQPNMPLQMTLLTLANAQTVATNATGCLFTPDALTLIPPTWFQQWWQPCAQCPNKVRVGNSADGKWLCDVGTHHHVVSVGSGRMFGYENDMNARYGSSVHVYGKADPPREGVPPWMRYSKVAMTAALLRSVAAAPLDVLRIDCQGCEHRLLGSDTLAVLHRANVQIQLGIRFQPIHTPLLWYRFERAGYFAANKEQNMQSSDAEYLMVPWQRELK